MLDVRNGFIGIVGKQDQLEVFGGDGAFFCHKMQVFLQRFEIVRSHDHNWEIHYFFGLHQREGLKKLVHGAKTARKNDKGIRVFYQKHLAYKKVTDCDKFVQVRIVYLFVWQRDVAPHRTPTSFPGAPVGGFHDTRPTTCHDRKAQLLNNFTADATGVFIVSVPLFKTGRSKHRDTRSGEVQPPKPLNKFPKNFEGKAQLEAPTARPVEPHRFSLIDKRFFQRRKDGVSNVLMKECVDVLLVGTLPVL